MGGEVMKGADETPDAATDQLANPQPTDQGPMP
jgi:hypothetical protein